MAELGATTEIAGSAAGAVARTSIWPHIDEQLVDLIEQHRTTLVFANSRRLAERITGARQRDRRGRALAAGAVPAQVARAHHGSVSKEQRALIEDDLKAGRLPAVVATSSLELGIDMGSIDLVVQVETPPSVASGLQRVGRAGHQVGAVSRGIVFPKYRGDLVTAAVVTSRMRAGAHRGPARPPQPARRAGAADRRLRGHGRLDGRRPARDGAARGALHGLTDAVLDSVLDMLSGRYPSDEFAELRPRLVWDRDAGCSAGAPVPSASRSPAAAPSRTADCSASSSSARAARGSGELDEEMVYESRVGDVIALGASSWRIEDITHDRVLVSPAPDSPAACPSGTATRSAVPPSSAGPSGPSSARSRQPATTPLRWPRAASTTGRARTSGSTFASSARRRPVVPSDTTIVVERFRDELGDWRVVVHSPFGARVHAPWALVIAARVRDTIGIDAQVMHADDGIVLRLPDVDDEESARSVLDVIVIEPDEVEALVTAEVGGSALFASRFRECAARALLLPRRRPDRRTPLWQQRQRSAHLLGVASDVRVRSRSSSRPSASACRTSTTSRPCARC